MILLIIMTLMVVWAVTQQWSAESLSSLDNSIGSSGACATQHGSLPTAGIVVLDFADIRRTSDTARLQQVVKYTAPKYEKFMRDAAGREHYALLHYLAATYGDHCRAVVDIGTRYVASSLALASTSSLQRVHIFDIPKSRERQVAFRGTAEQEWLERTVQDGLHIDFHNVDLLTMRESEFVQYMSNTWLIVLDTFHLPDTKPFKRDFWTRLSNMGIVILDDVYLNTEMKQWWKELEKGPITTYDVTAVGHFSGTGLVDFSKRVRIVNAREQNDTHASRRPGLP
jgi:hypothetical protein